MDGWLRRDLNLRPWAYESPALTTELLSQKLHNLNSSANSKKLNTLVTVLWIVE
jgi:hypothetical protein